MPKIQTIFDEDFAPTECDIRAMRKIEEQDEIERMFVEEHIEQGIEFPFWWEKLGKV